MHAMVLVSRAIFRISIKRKCIAIIPEWFLQIYVVGFCITCENVLTFFDKSRDHLY